MKIKILLILILLTTLGKGQECSPYHKIKHIKHNAPKSVGLGYVACLHATGVVAELGYDNMFIGVLAMGQGHHGATYSFLQYEYVIHQLIIYGGPAYKLNLDPGLIIGRVGADLRLYKRLYASASILQINRELNYLHVGFKIMY
jgi:hypothetical protein